MREKIRRSMAFLLTAVLLIGMVPDTVYANSTEMTAQKVTTGAVSTPEEQENTGEGTTTEAEKAAERTTTEKEAASEKITTEKESTTEDTAQPEKEITTEKETATENNSSTEENSSEDKNGSEKGTATEENDMVTTENASTETAPETEAASEETANQVTRKILKKTDPQSAAKSYMIYSDGSWSEGTIWYVNSGGKKHYVFCLDHGATMYTGKYTGTVTSGYSGEQAFRFSTALNFFKEMNGGYSKKSYYGTVQQVIWNQTDKNGLKTYVSNAWKLASCNGNRSAGSSSYNSKLKPVSSTNANSKSGRKKIAESNLTLTKIPQQEGRCEKSISLAGTAWKYFAKGEFPGGTSGISGDESPNIKVLGIYDTEGEDYSDYGARAYVTSKGNLQVEFSPSEGKGDDKNHPLTVIMRVDFPYRGDDHINYLKTAASVQNLTYSADASSSAYFATQVYTDTSPTVPGLPTVSVDKVDELGHPVSGCSFELKGVSGDALQKAPVDGKVIGNSDDKWIIQYTGDYEIWEVASNSPELNPVTDKPIATFTAADDGKGGTILQNPSSNVLESNRLSMSFTFRAVNHFVSGNASLIKYGNLLIGYENGEFIYEKRKLADVHFDFYTAEDIYLNDTLIFKKNTRIVDGTGWGGMTNPPAGWGFDPEYMHTVNITDNGITDDNGRISITDLPPGEYIAKEIKTIPGLKTINLSMPFEVVAQKTVNIKKSNGEDIINEMPPATVHVVKTDHETQEPLSGGEFTLYANVENTNFDGEPLFQASQTVPAVVSRDNLTGGVETEDNMWVPIESVVTEDGMADFTELPTGRYLIVETKAPEGYELAEESYEFVHDGISDPGANGYQFEHTFQDERQKSWKILKHAEKAVAADPETQISNVYVYEEQAVAGVTFGIYAAEDIYNTLGVKAAAAGTEIGTCVTDATGTATYSGHLYAGKYYFQELQTADDDRYILDNHQYPFTVSKDAADVINDTPLVNQLYKGSIKVIKTDGKTKKPLPGVEFTLLDSEKNELGIFVTDENGEIYIENLPVGTYYLQEVKTQTGYQLDDTIKEVSISKDALEQVAEFENFRTDTKISVKTDTTITGGGKVRTGDAMAIGFVMIIFLLSSLGAFGFGLSRKRCAAIRRDRHPVSKKFVLAFMISCGVVAIGGITATAAEALADIELKDVEYKGKIYSYALQKQYETTNPDKKITFEDIDGMKLDQVEYQTIDTIYPTKTQVLKEKKEYKELLQKDESGINKTLTVNGNTYSLDHVEWSEEPNVEHVSYTQDYGYATSEPKAAATYEYTYTSPVTKKQNTVTLPLLRIDRGEYRWVDGFSATVTFENLDGVYFKLGSHEFAYNPDKLALTDADYKELVKLLGYDTNKYRLNSGNWSGKAYEKKGIKCRKATVTGQQYAAPYQAVYEDDVQNGNIYTANAIYTYSQEVTDESAKPTYVMQATGYYEKAAPSVLLTIGIVIVVLLAIAVLYVISRKKKNVSSSREKESEKENLYRL